MLLGELRRSGGLLSVLLVVVVVVVRAECADGLVQYQLARIPGTYFTVLGSTLMGSSGDILLWCLLACASTVAQLAAGCVV